MTPFARISAAIEKLERLKADSTPGPWKVLDYDDTFLAGKGIVATLNTTDGFPRQQANADLIVTLHRTIDAHIAVLKYAEAELALGLADAILAGE